MRTMILVFISALTAVCSADKLDRTLLPPASAKYSGGDLESLQAPNFRIFDQGFKSIPSGGYTNEFQGVIVDAVNPSNRASGVEETGLGGPRYSYGSINSKVGDAAFRLVPGYGSTDGVASSRIAPGFESFVTSEDGKVAHGLRVAPGDISSGSKTLNFNNNIGLDKVSYDYGKNTGIADNKDDTSSDGVKVQEGYAFKVDDGKDLLLPIPPAVPLSLDNNAKEEAAGIVVNGSYNEQKYNEGDDYSENSNCNLYNHRQSIVYNNEAVSGPITQDDHSTFGDSSSITQGSTTYYSQETGPEGSQFGPTAGSSLSDKSSQLYNYQGYKPQFDVSTGTQVGDHSKFNSPVKTENNFGVQSTSPYFFPQFSLSKSSEVQNTAGKIPFGVSSSAFSPIVPTESGSATAFAQVGSEPKNIYPYRQAFGSKVQGVDYATISPAAIETTSVTDSSNNTESQQYSGELQSQNLSNAGPDQVFSLASTQKLLQNSAMPISFESQSQQQFDTIQMQYNYQNQFPSVSGYKPQANEMNPDKYTQGAVSYNSSDALSFNQKPIEVPSIELSTPLELNEKSFEFTSQPQNSHVGISNIHSTFSQENFANFSSNEFGEFQTNSTQKPLYNHEQEKEVSYYYNKPNKTFVITNKSTGIFSSFSLKPNVTQSTVSNSQQSLLNRRPFIQMQSKPASSFTQSNIGSTVIPLEYQGTIYEYDKPSESLSSSTTERENEVHGNPSSAEIVTKFSQVSSQFGNQFSKPIPTIILQQMQSSQFGSKPFNNTQSGSNILQSQIGQSDIGSQFDDKSQYNHKPFGNFQNGESVFQQNKLNLTYGSQFGLQSQITAGSSFKSNKYNQAVTQFHSKPFNSSYTTDYNTLKLQSDTSLTIPNISQSQSSQSFKPHFSGPQIATKPITFQQNQFGYSSGQIDQKPSAYNIGTDYGQKLSGSSQYAGSVGLKFGQTSSVIDAQNTSRLFSQKPTSGSNFQQTQFSTPIGFRLTQKPSNISQTTSTGFTQTRYHSTITTPVDQKPFGNSKSQEDQKQQVNQENRFSSNVSKDQTNFNLKPSFGSSSQISGFTSQPFQHSATAGPAFSKRPPASVSRFSISTASSQLNKNTPFDSLPTDFNFQQGYYGQNQGRWSSSSQYGKKAFTVTENKLSPFQQNQASLPRFQNLKKIQPRLGTSMTSNIFGQKQNFESNQFGQKHIQYPKPFGSSHFSGSTTTSYQSQFGSLPEFQFGKKPQSNYQRSRFGTISGLRFSQKPQTASGSRFAIGTAFLGESTHTTDKLLGSNDLQQNKFRTLTSISKDQTVQNTQYNQKSFANNNNFTTFEQKPQLADPSFTIGSVSLENDKKIIGNTQTVFNFQQNQFGSQYGKKPFGSLLNTTDQKTQPVETGYTPTNSQTQTSQFIQKPFVNTQIGAFQRNLFGSQYNQKPKCTVQSTNTVFTTQYPVSTSKSQFEHITTEPGQTSDFQESQFGSNRFILSKKTMFNIQNIGSVFGSQTQKSNNTNNFSATSKYEQKPQIATVNGFSSRETDSRFGNLQSNISSDVSNGTTASFQNTQQPQFIQSSQQFNQPFLTNQESQTSFNVNDQTTFKGTLLNQTTAISQTQFPQSVDQKIEQNLDNEQSTIAELQSTSSLETFEPIESYFNSEDKTQTSTPFISMFASTSPLDTNSNILKSLGIGTTQSPNYESLIEAAIFSFGKGQVYPGQPVANSFTATTQALPMIIFGTDSTKDLSSTTQTTFDQTNTTPSSTSGPDTQLTQSIISTIQSSNVSTPSLSTQSTLQTEAISVEPGVTAIALSSVENKTEKAMIEVDERLGISKEQFEPNRNPPIFDEQTGYYY